jgi:hypothetical protein
VRSNPLLTACKVSLDSLGLALYYAVSLQSSASREKSRLAPIAGGRVSDMVTCFDTSLCYTRELSWSIHFSALLSIPNTKSKESKENDLQSCKQERSEV